MATTRRIPPDHGLMHGGEHIGHRLSSFRRLHVSPSGETNGRGRYMATGVPAGEVCPPAVTELRHRRPFGPLGVLTPAGGVGYRGCPLFILRGRLVRCGQEGPFDGTRKPPRRASSSAQTAHEHIRLSDGR